MNNTTTTRDRRSFCYDYESVVDVFSFNWIRVLLGNSQELAIIAVDRSFVP